MYIDLEKIMSLAIANKPADIANLCADYLMQERVKAAARMLEENVSLIGHREFSARIVDGKQLFNTPQQVFLLNTPLQGIPAYTSEDKPLLKEASRDFIELINTAKAKCKMYSPIKCDKGELFSFVERHIVSSPEVYITPARLDAFQLFKTIVILGGEVRIYRGLNGEHPVYLESENGCALLMPLRPIIVGENASQ